MEHPRVVRPSETVHESPSESEIKTQHARFTARLPPKPSGPLGPGWHSPFYSDQGCTLCWIHGVLEEYKLIVLLCKSGDDLVNGPFGAWAVYWRYHLGHPFRPVTRRRCRQVKLSPENY